MHAQIKNLIIILLIALVLTLGIGLYFLNEQNKGLHSDMKSLEAQAINTIKSLNQTINSLQEENQVLYRNLQELNYSYNILLQRYKSLNQSYNQLGDAYTEQQSDLDRAITNINLYRHELSQSMDWFRLNSNIESLNDRNIERELEKNCIEDCKIKLGCLYLVNNQQDYNYKLDEETKNARDKLQSLKEFQTNGGGDCEDYGLFYKAELNYLLQSCSETTLETYEKENENRKYFLDFDGDWYIEGAKPLEFNGEFHPVVVCGLLFDLNTKEKNGHCIIAFPSKKIEQVNDLSSLENSMLIEPQDGSYYGKIGEETILKGQGSGKSYISVIITDKDLFLYSKTKEEWLSYSLFKDKLTELEKEMG